MYQIDYVRSALPGCAVPSEDALTWPLVPVGIPAIVLPATAPEDAPLPPGVLPGPAAGLYLADFVYSTLIFY